MLKSVRAAALVMIMLLSAPVAMAGPNGLGDDMQGHDYFPHTNLLAFGPPDDADALVAESANEMNAIRPAAGKDEAPAPAPTPEQHTPGSP